MKQPGALPEGGWGAACCLLLSSQTAARSHFSGNAASTSSLVIRHKLTPNPNPCCPRSGKSFLLNQLLGVGCKEGFGVGHTRATQVVGPWAARAPL